MPGFGRVAFYSLDLGNGSLVYEEWSMCTDYLNPASVE